MPTANYDASLLTNRNRNRALASFKNQVISANQKGTTVLLQQANTFMAAVNTQANLGCADGTCSAVAPYAGSNASGLPAYMQIVGSTPS